MDLTQEQRTQVVERWGDMVYRLALARTASVPDAEDIFQEVFLRYFRHEERFHSDEYRKAWLLRCTLNRCKSLLSSPWRRRPSLASFSGHFPFPSANPWRTRFIIIFYLD